jgi:hypothetical protein
MQYLTIENTGVCPIEGFTVLGVSTARGNESAIGQFGSGAKHGVLTCLRMGLNPIIYSGRTKIQFITEPANNYTKIFVKIGTKAPRELSIALEYGELDWTHVEMALREFVSNALDAVDGDASQVKFKTVERIHPNDDSTIIGIPMTTEVQRFYLELSQRFLHFSRDGSNKSGEKVLPKDKPGPARIYRKGVFVRELPPDTVSMFNYNFGEELHIDESRNMDDYSVSNAAACAICDNEKRLGEVISAVVHDNNVWEVKLGGVYRLERHAKDHQDVWQRAWISQFGNKAVTCPLLPEVFELAKSKGYFPIFISNPAWAAVLHSAGIKSVFKVLDNFNDDGHELFPATPDVIETCRVVWEWLKSVSMTKGKPCPPVKLFRSIMEAGANTFGYYKSGQVHIALGWETNKKVMLEELCHHITGANDCTRDFQDFAFTFSSALMGM